jgi:flagellar hook-basal body complex protein FliE
MKKLLLIILLTVLVLPLVAQDTVTVQDKELKVPENYKELREAYIEMAELYLEAEEDLTEALNNNDRLIAENQKLHNLLDRAQDNTEKAVRNTEKLMEGQDVLIDDVETLIKETEYWMSQRKSFHLYTGVLYTNDTNEPTQSNIGVGVGAEIKEEYNIGVYWHPMTQFTITFQYQLF